MLHITIDIEFDIDNDNEIFKLIAKKTRI